jgi:hypothetical protein
VTNTTDSPRSSTNLKAKTFKRGRWIKVTKGPYAGTKRWLSAESRTKLSANSYANKPWDKNKKKKAEANLTTYVTPPEPKIPETGTTVRLSQETATLLTNKTEGLTLDEAANYAIQYFCNNSLDGRILKKPSEPEIVTLPSF